MNKKRKQEYKIVISLNNISTTASTKIRLKNAGVWQNEYFHKDHLGNTRMVYGNQKQVDEYKATMETPLAAREQSQFYNITSSRVTGFNRTPAGIDVTAPDKSAETNGKLSGKTIGPAKMLQVSPGDRVQLEVFARYQTGTNNGTLVSNLAGAVTATFQVVSGEAAYTALNNNVPVQAATITKLSGVPKAYLFYILFNSSYGYVQFGYVQVQSPAQAAHQQLYLDIAIPVNGYLYTYVANESSVNPNTSVYFDDFKIVHTRNSAALQVLQTNDYYPFGATFNSYSRENSVPQNFLYQEKEWQQDLSLNLYDFEWRQYDPFTVRTTTMDPHADSYPSLSPYSWAANNPISIIDPDGRDITENAFATTYTGADAQSMFRQLQSQQSSRNSDGDPEKPTFYSMNSRTQARREQMAKQEKENQPGFWSGVGDGIVGGGESTIDFIKSLGTNQGWKDLGYGLMGVAQLAGTYGQVQAGMAVAQYVENIPNMSAYEMGYDLGYGTEKLAESILLSKGAGAAARFLNFGANGGYGVSMSLGRLGKFEFMYRNPSVRGGTLFSYKSVTGGKFRLDFHSFSTRGRTLHFHTNYGGYSASPHRSLNPMRFGQPIK
jgi:RHS repeat-associated protein